jgi:hypothetical protein
MAQITGIALDRNRSGRFELVATSDREGSRDTVWLAREVDDNGVAWTGWQGFGRLDGGTFSPATYQRHAEGSLEAVVVDQDMNVWRRWQTETDAWSEWTSLEAPGSGEGFLHGLSLTQNDDGRLEVFVGSQTKRAWHRWQKREGSTATWKEDWAPFGPPDGEVVGPVVLGRTTAFHLAAFVLANRAGADVQIWHTWQRGPGLGWAPWIPLGRPPGAEPSSMVVASNDDGRLEVFVVTTAGMVWHSWQRRADDPESWQRPWHNLGPEGGGLAEVDITKDIRRCLTLVAVSRSGRDLWKLAQAAPSDGWPLQWDKVATVPTGTLEHPTLYRRSNGGLGLFLLDGSTGGLHQRIQLQPDGDWEFNRDWEAP